MRNVILSFPGLGIEEFTLNPVAFLSVHWYGIIITLGMVIAFFYALYRAKQIGVKTDDMLDIALFLIPSAVIGARLYYVLTTLDQYDSFLDAIAIWNGGLAIYGGVIAGILSVVAVCRYKKLKALDVLDCIAPGLILAQAMGRWGNFFNGEAFGAVIPESSPLYFIRMGVLSPMSVDKFGDFAMHYVHPTFLYESVWNLIGFLLMHIFYKKKSFSGEVVLWYAAWYGLGRMFIEGLRIDSLMVGPFRISQVVAFVCFVGGVAGIVCKRIYDARKKRILKNNNG
ncbi:MAG: prolipoprotein diacylglyceryl transferase [Clostridia bacterium]|nr:prolipoprotein diacylglyceryl transferase [Clostridia bacterium]